MTPVMDNASYQKQISALYYPENKTPDSAAKAFNAHVLRSAGCQSTKVLRVRGRVRTG